MFQRFFRSVQRMRSAQRFVLIVLLVLTSVVGFASVVPSPTFAQPAKHTAQGQVTTAYRLPDGLHAALAQVNPYVQQAELTGDDNPLDDTFGVSVALSSDGRTALVGAPSQTVNGSLEQGVAYVFKASGGTWTQGAELTASDGTPADHFGESVALSSDGGTALIVALNHPLDSPNKGAAYVFTSSGGTWTQQAELTASDSAAEDDFGYSAALSGDGNTVL